MAYVKMPATNVITERSSTRLRLKKENEKKSLFAHFPRCVASSGGLPLSLPPEQAQKLANAKEKILAIGEGLISVKPADLAGIEPKGSLLKYSAIKQNNPLIARTRGARITALCIVNITPHVV